MFILHFIPDAFIELLVTGILVAGAGLYILAMCSFLLLFLKPYKSAISIIATILLVVGSYFKGGVGVELEWRTRVAEMQQQINEAEIKAEEATNHIETVVVEKIKIVKEKVHENKKSIQEHRDTINAECKLPDVARMLYNRAVTHEIPGSPADINATGSSTKTNHAE